MVNQYFRTPMWTWKFRPHSEIIKFHHFESYPSDSLTQVYRASQIPWFLFKVSLASENFDLRPSVSMIRYQFQPWIRTILMEIPLRTYISKRHIDGQPVFPWTWKFKTHGGDWEISETLIEGWKILGIILTISWLKSIPGWSNPFISLPRFPSLLAIWFRVPNAPYAFWSGCLDLLSK